MRYTAGKNIALKVPDHEYQETVRFYRETLGFEDAFESDENASSVAVKFGDNILWIDRITTLSQAEIWLELKTDNVEAARNDLESKGVKTRESIEPLPANIDGFWVSGPGNIIHLLHQQ
jgi:catechol 2,3-dioxygenase-like lactoylglutathione lyase family enzyme